jgi:hypothetical protein
MIPVADPFCVTCPCCGTHFDLTKSAVHLTFDDFDAVTAACPKCGTTCPVKGEPEPFARPDSG